MRWVGDESGGIAVYSAMLLGFSIGLGAIAVDFGRVVLLRSQMQNYADAAALAGAVQLDGSDGARERATRVVQQAIGARSGLVEGDQQLAISGVTFYQSLDGGVLATGDADALALEVVVQPRTLRFFFASTLSFVSRKASAQSISMNARAGAEPQPYICHAPPLMMCDLAEFDPDLDLRKPEHAGRQIRLKESQAGGGSLAPGNFGLLALPDGSSGANDIEAALAAVEPADCYSLDLTTATGSKTQKVRSGINARFDLPGGWPYPAPDVINYPRDQEFVSGSSEPIGSGEWDREQYWQDKHGASLPAILHGATRYQAYLYELGEPFGRKDRETIHPVEEALPEGFTLITPPGRDVPTAAGALRGNRDYDGEPSRPVAPNGPRRRLLKVPLLNCVADDVHGHGTYPSNGRFIEVFVTEEVREPPEAAIYGEVVRGLTPANDPDYHANVRLVR